MNSKTHAVVFCSLVGLACTFSTSAFGQAAPAVNPDGSGGGCVISGNAYLGKNTLIYDLPAGGTAIGKLTGAKGPMKATRFPKDSANGRVLINTGDGFRVEGYITPEALTVFANRDLSVAGTQLSISTATPLKVVGSSAGKLRVELKPGGGLSRSIYATAACEAFTFNEPSPVLFEVPRNARGYVARGGTLALYDRPSGNQVATLHPAGDVSGLLLWGTTPRNGFVNVTMRTDIFIDAWVRLTDVTPLPRGEMMDQVTPQTRGFYAPSVSLKENFRKMEAPGKATLRLGRGPTSPVIGGLEPRAKIYVLDTVLGWTSVLPVGLQVMPPDGSRGYWVLASELGLAPATPPQPVQPPKSPQPPKPPKPPQPSKPPKPTPPKKPVPPVKPTPFSNGK